MSLDITTYALAKKYTDKEIEKAVSSVYEYKGSVNTIQDLPSSGNKIGDIYNVISEGGQNFAWDGYTWDSLGVNQDATESNKGLVKLANATDITNNVQDKVPTASAVKSYVGEIEKVDDVQIDGTSIVNNRVANIPKASANTYGVIKTSDYYATQISNGYLSIVPADDTATRTGYENYKPVVPARQHRAAFYGLARAAGDTTQYASSNPVGTYTDEAKAKIQQMIGILSVEEVGF